MENITAPRITSASTFSSVCETSVPITTGSAWRGRPSRRATISAREGSPSRAGSVADISTPTAVPCQASVKRGFASGSAARRIAAQETARKTIEAHISASPITTHAGLDVTSVCATRSRPIRSIARYEPPIAPSAATRNSARRSSTAARHAVAGAGSSDGSRRAGRRGPRSAERSPIRTAARSVAPTGSGTARASSYAETTSAATFGQA